MGQGEIGGCMDVLYVGLLFVQKSRVCSRRSDQSNVGTVAGHFQFVGHLHCNLQYRIRYSHGIEAVARREDLGCGQPLFFNPFAAKGFGIAVEGHAPAHDQLADGKIVDLGRAHA